MPGRASRAALSAELSSTRSQCQPSWGYAAEGLSVCMELFRTSGVPLGYGARLSAAVEAGGRVRSGGVLPDRSDLPTEAVWPPEPDGGAWAEGLSGAGASLSRALS